MCFSGNILKHNYLIKSCFPTIIKLKKNHLGDRTGCKKLQMKTRTERIPTEAAYFRWLCSHCLWGRCSAMWVPSLCVTMVCEAGSQCCECTCPPPRPPRLAMVYETSAEPCELCKVVTPLSSALYALLDIYQPTCSRYWLDVEDPWEKKKLCKFKHRRCHEPRLQEGVVIFSPLD